MSLSVSSRSSRLVRPAPLRSSDRAIFLGASVRRIGSAQRREHVENAARDAVFAISRWMRGAVSQ